LPTELAIPESELRGCVRQRLDGGRLPLVIAPQVTAAYGTDLDICEVCEQSISGKMAAYEAIDPGTGIRLKFHFQCYVVWQRECAQRLAEV
jgi:hypothetical protein